MTLSSLLGVILASADVLPWLALPSAGAISSH
jgi:hypothetical protein